VTRADGMLRVRRAASVGAIPTRGSFGVAHDPEKLQAFDTIMREFS